MDSQFTSLKEELEDMLNYIQSEGYQNQNSHDSYFHQSHHDPNDPKKSLTELNRDVRNDLEDFKSCVRSMRTVHDKLFDRDDQAKTDLKKSISKFLDGQRVSSMYIKNNVNDMIIKMKQNEKNFQTKIKNMERKLDEWEKSQNISSEQTDRTNPPPPQAQTRISVAKDLWERVQLLMQGTSLTKHEREFTYQSPQAPMQLMTESPFVDLGFAILMFSPRDDLIACLNKAMAFLTAVASSRFPTTNNQLRTSSNLRNQATIQDGRVTVQQVQGDKGKIISVYLIEHATVQGEK
ncbi:hypothetical protein Tco_0876103 [Tanacetum coccineum]|uniref:Uncharacterized protein n=1 Tax=Tanacetum coccineum TaxID=301880 RepID=A0ABQ5BU95_9ASTR